MITCYNQIRKDIDSLMEFLTSLGVEAAIKSHLEDDYLEAINFLGKFERGHKDQLTEKGRTAVCGLHELYKWIWSIRGCGEFEVIIPHLNLLAELAIRINSKTPMINPVTGKQDDKSNKLIETIIAMFAIKVGKNVKLDDPIHSSDGKNPDVMFDYSGKRVAIACKTLRGSSLPTLLDNLKLASTQIKRADCDVGYIAINAMNILPHEKVQGHVFKDLHEPFKLLISDLNNLYLLIQNKDDRKIFSSEKVSPVILTFVHSNTLLQTPIGSLLTMLKITFETPIFIRANYEFDRSLLLQVNEFIHQRL